MILNKKSWSCSTHRAIHIFNYDHAHIIITRTVYAPTGIDAATNRLACKGVVENSRACVENTISDLIISDMNGIVRSSSASIVEAFEGYVLDGCTSSHAFIRLQGQPTGLAMITNPAFVNQKLHVLTSSDNLSTIVNSAIVMKVVCGLTVICKQATSEINVRCAVLKETCFVILISFDVFPYSTWRCLVPCLVGRETSSES